MVGPPSSVVLRDQEDASLRRLNQRVSQTALRRIRTSTRLKVSQLNARFGLSGAGRALVVAQLMAVPSSRSPRPDLDGLADRLARESLALLRSPSMRFFIGFDPFTALRRLSSPVLDIFWWA